MEELRQRLVELRDRYAALSARTRIALVTAAIALVGVAAVLGMRDDNGADSVLFSNLSEEDAAGIVERLRDLHVPYTLVDDGSAILVPEAQVHETRLTLAAEGLPSGGGVGFEIFDEQRFGESEFAEQVKYHRALEGELSRTIGHLAGVERARVHLVLPQRSLFTSTEQHATASVALRLRPGFRMDEERVGGIVHLVSSSVRGLTPENVTVVDGNGRRLEGGAGGGDGEELASDALEFRNQIEREKERAVQEMLDRTLGPGKSVVRVAAEVSFTREERTEETFDPEGIAPRSFQIDEERDSSSTTTTAGVPGAVSNLPGGEAPGPAGTQTEGVVRRSETRNFEVSKVVRRAIEPVGRVMRLNVAVMVDGRYEGTGEARAFEARSAEELAQLEAIVASAVGVDAERGDHVTVQCVPFAAEEIPEDEELIDPLAPIGPYRLFLPYVGYALGALALLVLLLVLRRKMKKALAASASGPKALSTPVTVRELESGLRGQMPTQGQMKSGEGEELRMLVADLAEQDPDAAARVVRGWLAEDTAS